MDAPAQAAGDPAQEDDDSLRPMLEKIIKELVSQRLLCWMAKKEKITDQALGAQIFAMCWDFGSMPDQGPGCLIPNPKGGYAYVPYDDSTEGVGPELEARVERLGRWCGENHAGVERMDKMMEKEVDERCWWEFLEGGDASGVDFHGKVSVFSRWSKTAAN